MDRCCLDASVQAERMGHPHGLDISWSLLSQRITGLSDLTEHLLWQFLGWRECWKHYSRHIGSKRNRGRTWRDTLDNIAYMRAITIEHGIYDERES